MNAPKIESTLENWETGALGADEAYVKVDDDDLESLINDNLAMRPISIRLEECLIDDFKMIAKHHGLSYQPMMRQVLKRFADNETRRILREYIANGKDKPKKAA
ncbi:hypothetical protein [Allopusillimonas ginsengisoli]|uniref:hypothetical protein n=1 Tax=Allopusillimonas ginsengisoli TaxID=453575 RepID=UPI00101F0B10|nr:hypothetical protein [Allopusillimonas ginsengisoli]TEA79059.1 hypothetical protein ERE07_06615 [Allopusillimonas ginsengisoli]